MNGPSVRGVSPARAVALALLVLAVLGLAHLRSASGTDRVSVPEGAEAGDLILEPCTYDTENGSYPADCGTLVVAENREDPGSRLIALPVTRIRARSDHPGEPVFRLDGRRLPLPAGGGRLLAVFTTIVGAAAGANLMLLVLDIAWGRQPRGPVVEADGWRTAGSARTVGSY